MDKNKNLRNDEIDQDSPLAPDPETLNTTDPQEHMEGPVSSSMKGISKTFETGESKKEAEERRDHNM